MRDDINMRPSRHSGDINFVAALMSQGVSLQKECPCRLVEGDRGLYTSYRYNEVTDDGKDHIAPLIDHWNGNRELPSQHGFAAVCRFIKARPRGIQNTTELLDFAVDYLIERGHSLPGLARLEDVPDFIEKHPDSEPSFILAYVWNREICFQLHRTAKRSIYLNDGDTHTIIDQRLPKWQRNELLSRHQG